MIYPEPILYFQIHWMREIARDYIVFEKPDVTLVILDATALERNMNLALQVMEITDRTIICINLIDEAEKMGIKINDKVINETLRSSGYKDFSQK